MRRAAWPRSSEARLQDAVLASVFFLPGRLCKAANVQQIECTVRGRFVKSSIAGLQEVRGGRTLGETQRKQPPRRAAAAAGLHAAAGPAEKGGWKESSGLDLAATTSSASCRVLSVLTWLLSNSWFELWSRTDRVAAGDRRQQGTPALNAMVSAFMTHPRSP